MAKDITSGQELESHRLPQRSVVTMTTLYAGWLRQCLHTVLHIHVHHPWIFQATHRANRLAEKRLFWTSLAVIPHELKQHWAKRFIGARY